MNLTDNMYWCDVCNSSHIGNNDEITTRYYETNQKQKFQQHIRSKKHIKMTGALEALTTIKCDHCNRKFTEEGYLIHTKRNEPLWKLKKLGIASIINMGCNNFNVGKRRYKSIDEFISKTAPDKPKQRRAKVGKISPISGMCRPPNKPNRTIEPSVSIDEPPSTSPDDLDCDEEPNLVLKIRNDDISQKDELLIDLYGTKLPFDDTCDSCYNPINYEYSCKLLNKLDIDVCNCDDTDTDSD